MRVCQRCGEVENHHEGQLHTFVGMDVSCLTCSSENTLTHHDEGCIVASEVCPNCGARKMSGFLLCGSCEYRAVEYPLAEQRRDENVLRSRVLPCTCGAELPSQHSLACPQVQLRIDALRGK